MREKGTYVGSMAHYGPSIVAFQPKTVETPHATFDLTTAPIDTAREINRSNRAAFEQAAHSARPRIRTLADINRATRALWRQKP